MANIDTAATTQRQRGFGRANRLSTRIDMTPMVDLGFLLITFFIFTSRMSEPNVTPLNMPNTDSGNIMEIGDSGAITILVGGSDSLFYYEGQLLTDGSNIKLSNSSDIRTVLMNKKKAVIASTATDASIKQCEQAAVANGTDVDACRQQKMFVVIKALPQANYKHIVNVLDEMTINKIIRYALVDADDKEMALLKATTP